MAETLNRKVESLSQLEEDRRAESRQRLPVRCDLWIFNDHGRRTIVEDARARNASFRGLSVLAPLPVPLQAGRPVEAVVHPPDGEPTHFAGTVAYCRAVGAEEYEIGIHVRAAGSHDILAGDVETSKALYDWFAKALGNE